MGAVSGGAALHQVLLNSTFTMETYKIIFPDGFDEYAEVKGWSIVEVEIGAKRFEIEFYEPTRLANEASAELSSTAAVVVHNVVVVDSVTREAIERAVDFIFRSGGFSRLTPLKPETT